MPQLRLSPTYRRLLARDAADREVRNYVKERFTAAIQLLKNIEQRKHTILRVCQSIIARQGEFLDHGQDALKPMMIKEVAEEVGVHPSTVSRAVASKYAHTSELQSHVNLVCRLLLDKKKDRAQLQHALRRVRVQ